MRCCIKVITLCEVKGTLPCSGEEGAHIRRSTLVSECLKQDLRVQLAHFNPITSKRIVFTAEAKCGAEMTTHCPLLVVITTYVSESRSGMFFTVNLQIFLTSIL